MDLSWDFSQSNLCFLYRAILINPDRRNYGPTVSRLLQIPKGIIFLMTKNPKAFTSLQVQGRWIKLRLHAVPCEPRVSGDYMTRI